MSAQQIRQRPQNGVRITNSREALTASATVQGYAGLKQTLRNPAGADPQLGDGETLCGVAQLVIRYQHISRQLEAFRQSPNHRQRKRAGAVQYLGHAATTADIGFQVLAG
jgi:hypothetical protein